VRLGAIEIVGVGVENAVGVALAVVEPEGVTGGVCVGVPVELGLADGGGVPDGAAVTDADGVGVAVSVAVSLGVDVPDGVALEVGVTLTVTSHTLNDGPWHR
jgi:hypothetical protein